MRVVIVGAGVSGLVCAHLLHPEHEVTVIEAEARLGGHVHVPQIVMHGLEDPRGLTGLDVEREHGSRIFFDRLRPVSAPLVGRLVAHRDIYETEIGVV